MNEGEGYITTEISQRKEKKKRKEKRKKTQRERREALRMGEELGVQIPGRGVLSP